MCYSLPGSMEVEPMAAHTKTPIQLRLLETVGPLPSRLGGSFFKNLPAVPGVYFFFNKEGLLLYIGQSNNLKARLGSYRHVVPERHPKRTLRLVNSIAKVEWQICETHDEAKRLEASLLLEHKPPFNRAGVWQGQPWWLRIEWLQENILLKHKQYTSVVPDNVKPIGLRIELSRETPEALESSVDLSVIENGDPLAVPALTTVEWLGPLSPSYRYVHGSLLRCVFKRLHPAQSFSLYPVGLMNFSVPLVCTLPLPLMERDALSASFSGKCRELMMAFALGERDVLMEELEKILTVSSIDPCDATVTMGTLETEYWTAELDSLRKYKSSQRPNDDGM